MAQWAYRCPIQGTQFYENCAFKGVQDFVYPSGTKSRTGSVETPHKHVKLSGQFRRLLAIAIALPLLALILVVYSGLSLHWERLEFIFHRIVQQACSSQNNASWQLAHVVMEGTGIPVTKFSKQTQLELCQQWKQAPPTILGVGIYNGSPENATLTEVFNVVGGAFQVCNEIHGKLFNYPVIISLSILISVFVSRTVKWSAHPTASSMAT
ncbi:unnamed protein product [Hydatigera taeniaeformis]|uniref:Transmembrane protein n=1 Tax=Hydatigena taeniaeformis TaxID=6205 RepID=A0A0R3WWU8_HYDTA|nr:unnamed protein product [Hydatigera taeniaeformis]